MDSGGRITHHTVNIESDEMGFFELVSNFDLKRSSIFESFVHRPDLFHHPIAYFCEALFRLVLEILVRTYASITRYYVLRSQVQRNHVHQNKPSPTSRMYLFEKCVYAIDIVGDLFPSHLAIREKDIVSQVVRSDPDCIHGFVFVDVQRRCDIRGQI